MATFKKGILGPISGKVGEQVYSSRNGIGHVRNLPKPSKKPATDKQLAQRMKFRLAMGFLTPLKNMLNDSYRKMNRKSTGIGSAARQILSEAFVGQYPELRIDFSKVSLIRGHLASPDAVMAYKRDTNELSFCWTEYLRNPNSFPDDRLIALLYSPSLPESWHQPNITAVRADEFCTVQMTQQCIGRHTHVWLGYQSQDGRAFSYSVYLGEILTSKSEDHESK
jgi:hypothetical protein